MLGRDPGDVGAAGQQAVGLLAGQQPARRTAGEGVVARGAVEVAVGRGGEADPGDRAGAELLQARAVGDVEGEVDRPVGALEGGELVEQLLGLRLLTGEHHRDRGQRGVVGPRQVRHPRRGRVVGGHVEGAHEPQRARLRGGEEVLDHGRGPGDGRRRLIAFGPTCLARNWASFLFGRLPRDFLAATPCGHDRPCEERAGASWRRWRRCRSPAAAWEAAGASSAPVRVVSRQGEQDARAGEGHVRDHRPPAEPALTRLDEVWTPRQEPNSRSWRSTSASTSSGGSPVASRRRLRATTSSRTSSRRPGSTAGAVRRCSSSSMSRLGLAAGGRAGVVRAQHLADLVVALRGVDGAAAAPRCRPDFTVVVDAAAPDVVVDLAAEEQRDDRDHGRDPDHREDDVAEGVLHPSPWSHGRARSPASRGVARLA